jgi:hypothetical protein
VEDTNYFYEAKPRSVLQSMGDERDTHHWRRQSLNCAAF